MMALYRSYWLALYPHVRRSILAALILTGLASVVLASARSARTPDPSRYSELTPRNVLTRGGTR